MLWKLDKLFATKPSIVNKLTILFTLTITTLLIATGLFGFFVVSEMIDSGEHQYLIDEIYIMRSLLAKNGDDINAIRQEVAGVPLALENANYHYYVEIIDINGKTLLQTPNMHTVIKNPSYPKLDRNDWEKHIVSWKNAEGQSYFSLVAPLQFAENGDIKSIARISIDNIYPQKILKQYEIKIIIFILLAIISVTLLSRFISKKGLSPLTDMITLTEKITISKLSERIDLKNYPDELVNLGRSLNTMLDRLEQAYYRMSECASELAHELRTPINNLMLSTDITLSKQRSIREYQDLLECNLSEYRQLANIIENILFLARSDNNQITLNSTHIDLADMTKKICQFYTISASEKQITIDYNVSGIIHADPVLLQRALANLLDNAIKFSPSGGMIHINSHSTDKNIHIAVHDNGPGIDPQHIAQIGCRGFRHQQIQTSNTGLGLGLALVKSIMNMHLGELIIANSHLGGAQVILAFKK